MDNIENIIRVKGFKEPVEISKLKKYILENFDSDSHIQVRSKGFVIIVNSSSLASAIRLKLPEIKRQLSINQDISIRIA
jgi:hypothetical protein